MSGSDKTKRGISRREFLEFGGFASLALGTNALAGTPTMATAAQSDAKAAGPAGSGPYNILFILTDQERYFDPSALPSGYALPKHDSGQACAIALLAQ